MKTILAALLCTLALVGCAAPKHDNLLRQWPERITGNHDFAPVIEKNKLLPLSPSSSDIRLRVIEASSWGYSVYSLAGSDANGPWALQVITSDKWNARGRKYNIPLTSTEAVAVQRLGNAIFTSNLPRERNPDPETITVDGGSVLIERDNGSPLYLIRDRIPPDTHEKEIDQLLIKLVKLSDHIER